MYDMTSLYNVIFSALSKGYIQVVRARLKPSFAIFMLISSRAYFKMPIWICMKTVFRFMFLFRKDRYCLTLYTAGVLERKNR